MSVLFFDHVYAIAGLDDITRIDENGQPAALNWYLGTGFTFDDRDLRALFGAASLTF